MPFTRANLRMPNEVNSPGRRQSFRHAERNGGHRRAGRGRGGWLRGRIATDGSPHALKETCREFPYYLSGCKTESP